MKFVWKLVALVSTLLALALAAGNLLQARGTLRAELNGALAEAAAETRQLGQQLQLLCGQAEPETDPDQTADRVLRQCAGVNTGLRLLNSRGEAVTVIGAVPAAALPELEPNTLQTRVLGTGENAVLRTVLRLTLPGGDYWLEQSRPTRIFSAARRQLWLRQWLMLAAAALCGGITFLLALWLTAPVRRISRTARQLAAGRYDRRVSIRGGDELAQTARDFNAMADALEQKIRELQAAADRQRDFTASFAHELKTPLTSVIGYADTLRSRVLSPERQMEAAGYIFSEGRRLEAMSLALLDLFSLERQAPELVSVSARRLVLELERSVDYPLKRSGLVLRSTVEERNLTVAPELMKTLLYNLIDNARKASRRGDEIALTGKQLPEGYCFTVSDRGTGIPPEALQRLTEPFYMVDKSRARAKGGAGLGLALCQKIAEAHGGRLEFESTPGEGTRVRLVLGGEQT